MAYYFMVEKKKGDYLPLEISDSNLFTEKRKYVKPHAYTLQEIDKFTMMFNNEVELRNYLISEGILNLELATKPLSTRWVSKGKYNKIPYDFLYQRHIEYVMDPTKLVDYILRRYNKNDFVFIKKFAEYFSSTYECSSTASDVRMYAEMAIRDRIGNRYLEERDKNNNNLVERLIKLLLLEHTELPNGFIVYKDKINYRNLHNILAFITNYLKKQNIQLDIPKEETPKVIENKTKSIEEEFVEEQRNKKRIKRKDSLPGQLSIFDIPENK